MYSRIFSEVQYERHTVFKYLAGALRIPIYLNAEQIKTIFLAHSQMKTTNI
jgi:hypothetical protein